ncbi:MAG: LCP family protein [Acidimicrobiia bacterium]|nr:LCP family protein [Acidimicrobiia bacterium]
MKRLILPLAIVLSVAACGSTTNDTTTTSPTLPTSSSTLASEPTTTVDTFGVAITATGPPGLIEAITAGYRYAGGTGPLPSATPGFAEHLAGATPSGDINAEFGLTVAELSDGWVGVGVWQDDLVLATSADGEAWALVGGRLTSMGLAPYFGDEPHRLFIIGSDARTKQDPVKLRADSLHLVNVAPDGSSASIVGLPRDTYVEASYGGKTKFTNVMSGRGPEVVVATGTLLTALEFDGYIVTGFSGFTKLVNNFGGFEIDIPFDMAEPKSKAYFSAGRQMIDGFQALAFARNRMLKGGDFTRSFHHGVIMQWGLASVIGKGPLNIPTDLKLLDEYTFTNLPIENRLLVLAALFELDPFEIPNIVVDGTPGMAGKASVVFLNDSAFNVFADLADGRLDETGE